MHLRIKVCYDFLSHLGSYRSIMHFQIRSKRKNRQRYAWVVKIRVLGKLFSKQFCFFRCRRQHLRPLVRGGIADLLFLWTLLAICKRSREPSFWKVTDAFDLLAYAGLVAWRVLLQKLLACLSFTLNSEDLIC